MRMNFILPPPIYRHHHLARSPERIISYTSCTRIHKAETFKKKVVHIKLSQNELIRCPTILSNLEVTAFLFYKKYDQRQDE